MNTLNFATIGLLAILLTIVLLFIVVFMKAIKVASGRGVARRDGGGESVMLSMALQETLTRLKQQERAMAARAEASERLSEQIVEGLTSGLVVVDRNGVVQAINPAARRILEIDGGGTGMSFRDALHPAPALSTLIAEAIEGTSPIVRRTITLGGARPRHLGVTVSPITAADGLQAAVCLFTDLTAVVELEEQLRLKEALARLGELTAGLAHEFRNGLATIHGYGRLLDPATLPEPARTCVGGIRSETVALGEVVTNFLRFARPDQMILAPVDLRAVITRAIEDVPDAPAAVALEGRFGTVSGDDVLLRQAFANLIRNSLEACAEGGVVPQISVSGDVTSSDSQVVIEDNGPGFTPEALTKAFQPFATTKASGTGLGLAIVQKVIVSHNGLITVTNRPEGGAQFRIKLPLAGRT